MPHLCVCVCVCVHLCVCTCVHVYVSVHRPLFLPKPLCSCPTCCDGLTSFRYARCAKLNSSISLEEGCLLARGRCDFHCSPSVLLWCTHCFLLLSGKPGRMFVLFCCDRAPRPQLTSRACFRGLRCRSPTLSRR